MPLFITKETDLGNGTTSIEQVPPYSSAFDCPSTVLVGDVVYLSAANTIDKAVSDDVTKRPAIGFVKSKPTPTTALIQWGGELAVYSGLTPGATQYLSAVAGQITEVAPILPGNIVQKLGFARNATTLVIQVNRDFIAL